MGVQRVRSLLSRPAGGDFSEDTVFEVLRNQRRRYALHLLKQRGGEVATGSLAEQVAAWENDTVVEEVTAADRKRVYISLLQSHLPLMEESGIVSVDEEENRVRLTDAAAEIDVYVEILPEGDLVWGEYYLALAGLVGGFLVVVWFDVYPFVEIEDSVWFGFAAALFFVSALVHHLYQRRLRLGIAGPPPEYER